MHDCNIRLRGYLSTGKFIVNDYTIEIEKTNDGVLLTITGGNGEMQQALITNGKDGNLDEINAKLLEMLDQQTAYAAAEELRAAAEASRAAAERARGTAEDHRNQAFGAWFDLLSEKERNIDAAAEAARIFADQAATEAERAAAAATGGLYGDLFYQDGDYIEFYEPEYDGVGDGVHVSVDGTGLNAYGYVTSSKKRVVVSIPVAKSLKYVTDIQCTDLTAHVVNSGGYGLTSASTDTGSDYLPLLKYLTVNKIRNTIDLTLERSTAFYLNNNETVAMRVKSSMKNGVKSGVKFVLRCGGNE